VLGCPYCFPDAEHIFIHQLWTKQTQIKHNISAPRENTVVPYFVMLLVCGFELSHIPKISDMILQEKK
jgi:hypothetical protein